jgi:superfamily II DNA or RNA helicase
MSCKKNIDELEYEIREKINTELQIKLEDNKYNSSAPSRYIYPYEIVEDDIYLPFAYAFRQLKLQRPTRNMFPTISINFEAELRPEQKVVNKEAIEILSKKGSVIISCYCGFGKSICSINLACNIGFKTLIIVNKIVLMKQWMESINQFCPSATVQKLTVKSVKKESDFYIMNAINIPKMGKHFFADIACVIIDEAHLIMAETLSKSLQFVSPRYLIGLTATPYRPDGLDILLELYFGKYKIIRKLFREHTAYVVQTGFVPRLELAKNGKINWGVILDSQANDEARNELILKIVQHFQERTFLILVKRVIQGNYLISKLTELGENVTSLLGSQQEFNVDSRIIVGSCQKCGTGFDHPRLDTLLLAGDIEEYFVQYIGRVFRRQDVVPIIFDLVDRNPILKKHFNTRRSVYLEHGGTVRNFDMNILNK